MKRERIENEIYKSTLLDDLLVVAAIVDGSGGFPIQRVTNIEKKEIHKSHHRNAESDS